jgi:hypothetical protein
MWLSPFLAELYIWGRWSIQGEFWYKLSYMALGGKGTSDVLFWYGFMALIAMFSFNVILKYLIGLLRRAGAHVYG